jgi:post-segregation antitoxin (ccd killing protein)
MVIRVKVPDELAAQARVRGVPLEEYIEELLNQQVARRSAATEQPRTPEQVRAWLDSLAQFSDKIPPLPETISREWIYQDHD